ncbi:oligosaccharide repeat unit polymerase [Flammeovirga pacifica]|uniref:Uncharacterized protein n=1 Tax=Flammeovirga pacifica TaxID=915059 RepID=A0A1S1Z1Y3_FLAPC|nr:oligosaccharide repeat unit polymerase [Flammeovirga pacifica]OHX67115.1 hypothetical protein NH26_12565 [Flammeovirga pacifica]
MNTVELIKLFSKQNIITNKLESKIFNLIITFFIIFSAFTFGISYDIIFQNKNDIAISFIHISGLLSSVSLMIKDFFPTYRNVIFINSSRYNLKKINLFKLILINELFNLPLILYFIFLTTFILFSNYISTNDFLIIISYGIVIFYLNIYIRIFIELKNKLLFMINLISILITSILFIYFKIYYISIVSLFILNFLLYISIYKENSIKYKKKYKIKLPIFKDSIYFILIKDKHSLINIITALAGKIVMIIAILSPLKKIFLGIDYWGLIIFSPAMYFTYYLNNFFGYNKTLLLNIIQSREKFKLINKLFLKNTFILYTIDFFILIIVVTYIELNNIDLLLKTQEILFYFLLSAIILPQIGLFISYKFPIKIEKSLTNKSNTSIIGVIITMSTVSIILLFVLLIKSIFIILFLFMLIFSFILYKKNKNIISSNCNNILFKLKNT